MNLLCTVTGTTTKSASCPPRPDKSALVTSYSYTDKINQFFPTKVENPEGHSTFACYDHGEQEEAEGHKCPPPEAEQPTGSLQNENDPLSSENELKFSYNKNGTIKGSTDAGKHTTTYEYDEKGNLKKITPPVPLSPTTITVDADSRPHVITDGAGHIETITYDNDDRITKIEYSGTGTAKTVTLEYDADGDMIKREDPTGTTKYTVDALNRLTKEELPGAVTHSYEYDAAPNMLSYTDGGGTTAYKYNGLNELESMTEPKSIGTDTFAYDNDHRLKKITYPSGVVESYKLEPTTGRPETITVEHTTGTAVPNFTYTYKEGENDTSLIQTMTESTGNKTTYSYDPLNRLTKALTTGTNPSFYKFAVNGVGNRTEQKVNLAKGEEAGSEATFYAYNAANELKCRQTVALVEGKCSGSSTTELSHYEYDKAGEESAIVPKADTSGATFAYNAAGELSSLTPTGESALSLTYGGTGQDDLVTRGSTTTLEKPPGHHPRSNLRQPRLLRAHTQRPAHRRPHPISQLQPAVRRARRYHRARELNRQSRTNVPIRSIRRERPQRRHTDHPLPVRIQGRLPHARRQHRTRQRPQQHPALRSTLLRPHHRTLDTTRPGRTRR